jgi:hypothetical protein
MSPLPRTRIATPAPAWRPRPLFKPAPSPVPASVLAEAARHPTCGYLSLVIAEFAS